MVIFLMILSLSLIKILKYVQIYSEVSFSSSSRYISAYISETLCLVECNHPVQS